MERNGRVKQIDRMGDEEFLIRTKENGTLLTEFERERKFNWIYYQVKWNINNCSGGHVVKGVEKK